MLQLGAGAPHLSRHVSRDSLTMSIARRIFNWSPPPPPPPPIDKLLPTLLYIGAAGCCMIYTHLGSDGHYIKLLSTWKVIVQLSFESDDSSRYGHSEHVLQVVMSYCIT